MWSPATGASALPEYEIVVLEGELPYEENRRAGPGWWMDIDGVWHSPREWPEDDPPLDGWARGDDGFWHAPRVEVERLWAPVQVERLGPAVVALAEPPDDVIAPKTLSRQAQADRRAMFTVAGVIAGATLLLVAALILITQAGASDPDEPDPESSEVIYAVQTEALRAARQREVALEAPTVARAQLSALTVRPSIVLEQTAETFEPDDWRPNGERCLDFDEIVLVERSSVPVAWADQLECVPDQGRWTDRYLESVLTRTVDAEVVPLIPPRVVHASGGASWTALTRQSYLTDLEHRATLQIVSAGAGHNPRDQDPSQWKPSSGDIWCAYAVDWISVKSHWQLDVHEAEVMALAEMLDTCNAATSSGADPETVLVEPLAPPTIERVTEG